LKALGFLFMTLDLEGLRSGSLNQLVGLEKQRLFGRKTLLPIDEGLPT
jgi:hypothetical protein